MYVGSLKVLKTMCIWTKNNMCLTSYINPQLTPYKIKNKIIKINPKYVTQLTKGLG